MAQIQDLPNEILEKIITELPPKTYIKLSETNKKFNNLTIATGWKHHYIKDFPENSNTGQLIKDSYKHLKPAWYDIYKEEYENKKYENKKKKILMNHWRSKRIWYSETNYHTIREITDKLCEEKITPRKIKKITNKKKRSTYKSEFEF